MEGNDVRMIDVDTVITTLKHGSKTISAEGNPSWDLIKILGGTQKVKNVVIKNGNIAE